MAIEQSVNLSDEVTEGQSSVRTEEERVEREGWVIGSYFNIWLNFNRICMASTLWPSEFRMTGFLIIYLPCFLVLLQCLFESFFCYLCNCKLSFWLLEIISFHNCK